MPVAELGHAPMAASQQILVEIKYRYVKDAAELPLERSSIGGDTA